MTCDLRTAGFLGFMIIASTFAESAAANDAEAQRIIDRTRIRGGFIVHVGIGDGERTAALRRNASFQVHGLSRSADEVAAARRRIQELGIYGEVSVDRWNGGSLPYVDNLVNLLVIENPGDVAEEEVLRVLTPGGVACRKDDQGEWSVSTKPVPENIDDWSHYLHDASGNAVAHDDVVGPPRHLQWVGSPRWSRHHDRMASMSALVSTGGRMFYIMDEGSRVSIQMPPRWKLIARDAFNGTVLWKRDIAKWQNHLWPLKSGPTQLSRRLVASDDELYVTFALEAPLTAVDAATGETLREYADSDSTEEVILEGGVLFLVINKGQHELREYAALHNTGDQGRVAKEYAWDEQQRVVAAYDAATGEQMWARVTRVSPLTLSADASRVYLHDGERVQALDRTSGEVVWSSEEVSRRKAVTFNFGPRLVVYEDVVLFAGGDGKIASLNAESGDTLWTAAHPNSGYQSPQDVMVANGLVWYAATTSGRDDGVFTGRDPRTGEVKFEFPPDVDTYWFHHRCYIAKATDNFIIPSRTGIEFVDPTSEHWNIHHWVRGGCLYGVMPCNGMVYAPPHNCACYPEAKLFGFNALAPTAPTRPVPQEVSDEGRLERGPAWDVSLAETDESKAVTDWATYRGDSSRSGYRAQPLPKKVARNWTTELGGRLTPPVVADGLAIVAQIDAHAVHAVDSASGEKIWSYTAGGRVDSPPTIHSGRVLFGCADGSVYCLQADNGELAWRFRAAPEDRRLMAYEQLESVWPVHGSILVIDDVAWFVAGRSVFLDGGLRLLRLDVATGEKISETLLDDRNPETNENLQELLQTLQMPVGLPDILTTDGKYVYMRSQLFDLEGNRLALGPHSGNAATHGGTQRGEGVHLFAPMGFLDDSWFHRSYWVWGRSFAGGHNGYYQAGRFAPSGRLLVTGSGYVYGYGRKPQYYKWTTTLEHQLFAAGTDPPSVDVPDEQNSGSVVRFQKTDSLNPAGKPIAVEAWINSTRPGGVILARGGSQHGFALALVGGKPVFLVRAAGNLQRVAGPKRIVGEWHHVAGVLTADKQMRLYVDGERVAQKKADSFVPNDPAEPLEIGADIGSTVGNNRAGQGFTGLIDDVRVYYANLDDDAIRARARNPEVAADAPAVLWVDFDEADGRDRSAHRNNGVVLNAEPVDGRFGRALKFTGSNRGANQGNSFVEPKWTSDLPIYVRGMVLADRRLYLVGPADIIDEEQTFQRITDRDDSVLEILSRQDRVLDGAEGSQLLIVDTDSGEVQERLDLSALPVWDGLAAAGKNLYLTTTNGQLVCLGGE